MDVPGTFTQNLTLGTQLTTAIDLAGHSAELTPVFSGAGGDGTFFNSGIGGSLSLIGISNSTGIKTVFAGAIVRFLGLIASSRGGMPSGLAINDSNPCRRTSAAGELIGPWRHEVARVR